MPALENLALYEWDPDLPPDFSLASEFEPGVTLTQFIKDLEDYGGMNNT